MLYQALSSGFKGRMGRSPVNQEEKDLKLLSAILVGPRQSLLREIPKSYHTLTVACGPPQIELCLRNKMKGTSKRAGIFAFSHYHFFTFQEVDKKRTTLEVIALAHPREQLPLILLHKPRNVFWTCFMDVFLENF
ncbi:hypothetical protein [Echinicola rosea]|nr:hypothetical protein [Echinicola rosea]